MPCSTGIIIGSKFLLNMTTKSVSQILVFFFSMSISCDKLVEKEYRIISFFEIINGEIVSDNEEQLKDKCGVGRIK